MSKDRDSQWQQQKTDEVSTFGESGFTHSSTLDSRLGEHKRPQRATSRRSRSKLSWVLVLILMVVLAGVAVLKAITYLT